tara:strand:+ start:228 stop:830 length:603 start_codon:yes stop_codon:yes gene_type:complete
MKVVTLTNSKGGVGKSTIASNLIYLAIEMNYSVAFIDLDKQKSLDEWVKKQKVEIKKIKINDLSKFTKKKLKFDFLFIDTQASIRRTKLEEILRITDIVVIPSSNTYLDLNATRKFLKRINSYREKNIKICTVLNRIRFSKKIEDVIIKSENVLKEKIFAWFPMSRKFDDQMSLGSTILKSNYAQTRLVREQLLNIINKF